MHDQISPDVYDVNSFCASHKISRGHFYQLLKQGKGPRIAKVGRRTLITKESAAAWRAQLDSEAVA